MSTKHINKWIEANPERFFCMDSQIRTEYMQNTSHLEFSFGASPNLTDLTHNLRRLMAKGVNKFTDKDVQYLEKTQEQLFNLWHLYSHSVKALAWIKVLESLDEPNVNEDVLSILKANVPIQAYEIINKDNELLSAEEKNDEE